MTQGSNTWNESDERHATLLNNAQAVRALCSAIEGTLGPKGLDVMLVGPNGDVIITNDGVTILESMDVSHPIAKLVIQVARAQQHEVGDGTTTATVLAGALVQAGVEQVVEGVPAAKVAAGVEHGVNIARELLQERAIPIQGFDDPLLHQAVHIAGREHNDIVQLVMDAARAVGIHQLQSPQYRFADSIVAHEKAKNEWFEGLLLKQKPLQQEWHSKRENCRVVVMQDSLEPEAMDEHLLTTEAGFEQYMRLKASFMEQLQELHALHVGFIVLERGIAPEAEQFCLDHDIMVIQRVSREDVKKVAKLTGAKPLKRSALHKDQEALRSMLGNAELVYYDERLERVRLYAGKTSEYTARTDKLVTMIVGASTREVVGERVRIAADAAAALQAAVQSGILPGGGATELALAYKLERYRETVRGMEAFGIAAVAHALRKPMSQIVLNAGFNPLEKLEEARAAQASEGTDTIGIHCDTGSLMDTLKAGIVDPAQVKLHALAAAGEVACAVLRIHTVIKMKSQ
ncbi:MAG: TCP-1/cpn60 chaperonin family protein [Paenibacillus sp.]|nr:TCP-1/cpn60 chaperonin family protein [Paenibacillus sp.]